MGVEVVLKVRLGDQNNKINNKVSGGLIMTSQSEYAKALMR